MRGSSEILVAPRSRGFDVRSLVDGVVRRQAHALFSRITDGQITFVERGERVTVGTPGSLEATVTVHSLAAYRALLLGGSLGGAEAYMQGLWSCDDLAALARIFARNLAALEAMEGGAAQVSRLFLRIAALGRRNTRSGSRRNIAAHYDLNNDFFRLFLDESMMYSSAIFDGESTSLEAAQARKLDRVCQRLALGPNDHLLEIGTGWGALAIHAAERYGCRVTTTTVSVEQHRLASERVRSRGLGDRVRVLLSDYRDLEGTYDKLVSIEMIEAVGHEYLGQFFRTCADRLTPEGIMLVQAITIADQWHEQHRASVDFIKEYIFPGSCIPSVTTMVSACTRESDLRMVELLDLTPHYAKTLRIWRERFMQSADAVRALGFDEHFLRMWEYYLAYCEGGFEERYLGSVHMTLAKPRARLASSFP